MKMLRILFITSTLLYLESVSADLQLRCSDFIFFSNATGTIMTQGYPRQTKALNCSNYFPFHSNSSLVVFELEDINMYYTDHGNKVCDAIAVFGTYSLPCLEDEPMCIVITNDRYCLSDGLPKIYSQCMIIYSDFPYVPVHIKFKGRYGTEAYCMNPNEPESSCEKKYMMTYARGIKTKYLQTHCRKAENTNNIITTASPTTSKTSAPVSTTATTTEDQDWIIGNQPINKPDNSDRGQDEDTRRYAIIFSIIGAAVILITAIAVALARRYRFKNNRARKRMMRNQGSTATMVDSVIYGSTPEYPLSTFPSSDGASIFAMESTNTVTENGEYCYIDFDINKNQEQNKPRFPCQYRRDGVNYIPNDERKNALYEEARSFT